MIRRFLAISMLALLAGCATKSEMKMTPAASEDVGVRFSRGEAFMLSGGDRGAVMVVPRRYDGNSQRVALVVAGYNRSGQPINFGAENVTLILDNSDQLPVYTYDSIRRRLKGQADQQRVAAFAEAMMVGLSTYEDQEGAYNREGRAVRTATTHYDRRLHSIADNLAYEARAARRVLLQTTTIDPDTYWAGTVIADAPTLMTGEVRRLSVQVTFAGEPHRFELFLAPEDTPTPPQISLPAVTLAEGMQTLHTTPATWLWDTPLPSSSQKSDKVCLDLRTVLYCGPPIVR